MRIKTLSVLLFLTLLLATPAGPGAAQTPEQPAAEESEVGTSDSGFCLACGMEKFQVEPDARRYPCDSCGKCEVYGAQEILIREVA